MAHFTQTFSSGAPIVDVVIGVSHARLQVLEEQSLPSPPIQYVRGLIDTGASHTCADPLIFTALGLQPTGTVQMHTPSTGDKTATAYVYDVGIVIPHTGVMGISDGLAIPNVQVSACELYQAQSFHVLIGRDILNECIFSYNGATGAFTLAY